MKFKSTWSVRFWMYQFNKPETDNCTGHILKLPLIPLYHHIFFPHEGSIFYWRQRWSAQYLVETRMPSAQSALCLATLRKTKSQICFSGDFIKHEADEESHRQHRKEQHREVRLGKLAWLLTWSKERGSKSFFFFFFKYTTDLQIKIQNVMAPQFAQYIFTFPQASLSCVVNT